MSSLAYSRSGFDVHVVVAVLLALASLGDAQNEREVAAAPNSGAATSPLTVIEGVVLESDGSPSEGALVVSSAGARALTDVFGRYRLEEQLPTGATALQISASRAGNLRARTRVAPAASGVTYPGPLLLGSLSPCSPSWTPYGNDSIIRGPLFAATTYDDGGGTALYVGGAFTRAGAQAVNHLVRWNGSAWEDVGGGVTGTFSDRAVRVMLVRDVGAGPVLVVGGQFQSAGGVPANRIASWDGTAWTAFGAGLDHEVRCLAEYDDGQGQVLAVGGLFTHAGGASAQHIATWDGASWATLGSGFNDQVHALAVFDDGSGSALFAGGLFATAGGVPATRIAKWNGASWSAVGGGMTQGFVDSLVVFDDGSGPALYASGTFQVAGGAPALSIARWNGASWATVGGGFDGPVRTLRVYDDGSGAALYAGGNFTSAGGTPAKNVARWNGTAWQALDIGAAGDVRTLAEFDDGNGVALYAGAQTPANPFGYQRLVNNLSRWDGAHWSTLEEGFDHTIHALAVADTGNGPLLYAGGEFATAGHVAAVDRAVAWDGTSFSSLGTGLSWDVSALAQFGPELYVGGDFTVAGGSPASHIARWDGASWAPLGSGLSSSVNALLVFDDGSGEALYAGGGFVTAGGVTARSVARWNGSSWSAVDYASNDFVYSLAEFDDGGGPRLYAAGSLPLLKHVARWTGTTWRPLGAGLNDHVHALAVFDDGSGPALYAGGDFTVAGGSPASHVARWDGASWSALGNGVNDDVFALAVHDDGNGPALYAGGGFSLAGGVPANHIARWDGVDWAPLDDGTSTSVAALAVYDDGHGPGLYAGTRKALNGGVSYLQRWAPLDSEAPTLHVPGEVAVRDRAANGPGEFVSFAVSASDDVDPTPGVVCVPPSGSFFPAGTTLVTFTATDACGKQSVAQFNVTVGDGARQRQK